MAISAAELVLRMQSNMSLAICDLLIVRDYAKYHARYTPSFSVHMVGKKLAKPAVSGLVAANVPGSEARGEASIVNDAMVKNAGRAAVHGRGTSGQRPAQVDQKYGSADIRTPKASD